MTAHIHAGKSVRRVDDRNALIIHEACGHTDAIARRDDEVLTDCDLSQMKQLPCQRCREWEGL